MSHATQLELSMLADEALPEASRARVQSHVSACAQCREQLALLKQEVQLLRHALAFAPVSIPAFQAPLRFADLFKGVLMLGGLAWIMVFLWQSLLSPLVMQIAGWFNPFHISESISLTVDTVFYVSEEGSSLIETLYSLAGFALAFGLVLWVLSTRPSARGLMVICAGILVAAGTMVPEPAQALEIRRVEGRQSLTIGADEVVEDSMIVMAESVIIDGRIEGDLIAFGRRVIVDGVITGNLISFSQSITVGGEVQGSMLNFSQYASLSSGNVMSNLWTFANSMQIDRSSTIGGNATLFTSTSNVEGSVGRDLTNFSENIEVSGSIGDDISAWANSLDLMNGANVSGDVTFHTSREEQFQRLGDATVGGAVDVKIHERGMRTRPNRYATAHFYINQLLRIGGAFIAGLCLLSLFPGLRQMQLGGGMDTLKSAGLGFLALISMPLAAGILAVTFIGIPLAVMTIFGWVVLWFFAKIMLAWVIGNRLLVSRQGTSWALVLLAGIAVVIVVVNLPKVGGILNFCMTLVGAGLLVSPLLKHLQKE